MVCKHYLDGEEQEDPTFSISSYITSRDCTAPTRAQTKCLLAFRKHGTLKKAALREDYRNDGEGSVTVPLGAAGSVVSGVWPTEAHKRLKFGCGRTSGQWTDGGGLSDGTAGLIL